jgi:hypothetical protein
VTMRVRVRSEASDLIYSPAVRHIHVKSFRCIHKYVVKVGLAVTLKLGR